MRVYPPEGSTLPTTVSAVALPPPAELKLELRDTESPVSAAVGPALWSSSTARGLHLDLLLHVVS